MSVSLQVVTAASLRRTAEWMAGQSAPIPEAVLQALAEILRGAVEGTCEVAIKEGTETRRERR